VTEPKWASAASFRQVNNLELDSFAGRQGLRGSSHPAVLFENVTGAIVRDSRADEGCGVFLSIRGANTRNIKLRNNDLEVARTSVEFETPGLREYVAIQK
jgi:hypothetical protein